MKINKKNQDHKMQIKWKQHAKRINKRTNLLRETLLINHYSIYAYGFMRNMSLRCDIEWHMLLQTIYTEICSTCIS